VSLRAALLGLALSALPVAAQDMSRSPVPLQNPALVTAPAPSLAATAPASTAPNSTAPISTAPNSTAPVSTVTTSRSLRPRPRPGVIVALTAAVAEARKPEPFLAGLLRPRPADDLSVKAEDPPPRKRKATSRKRKPTSRKGSVCGVDEIKGEALAPITSRVDGCGVADPVRVTSVAGVTLSQSAAIDCDTARALNTWVDTFVQPAFGGNPVVELQVAAHYVCRGRNNMPGGQISEHGKGRAIDISGFRLLDGSVLTVKSDYNRILRRVHDQACGIFGTTLGPGSDGYHEDHIHLDTARHGNGPYCR